MRTKRGKVGIDEERIAGWPSGVATKFRAVLDATFWRLSAVKSSGKMGQELPSAVGAGGDIGC